MKTSDSADFMNYGWEGIEFKGEAFKKNQLALQLEKLNKIIMKKVVFVIGLTLLSIKSAFAQFPPPPAIGPLQLIKSISTNVGLAGSPVTIITNENTINSAKFGVGSTEETTTKIGDGDLSNTFNTPFKPDLGTYEVIFNYDEISGLGLSPNSVISSFEFYVQSGIPTQLENFKITASLSGYSNTTFESVTKFGVVFEKTNYIPTIENGKIRIVLDSPIVLDNDFTYLDFQLTFNYDNNIESNPEDALSIESSDIYGQTRPNIGLGIFTYSGGVTATEINNVNNTTYIVNAPAGGSTGRILIEETGAYAISKDSFYFIPPTKIVSTQCGKYISDLSSLIYCNLSSDAQAYLFEVTENGVVRTYESATNKFKLTDLVGGAEYGKNYSIRVSIKYDNVWGAYGTACEVSTPSGPPTKLVSSQCGVTLSAVNTTLYCNKITSAEAYKFEVTLNGVVNTIENTTNSFSLTNLSNVNYNATYAIRVAAKYNGVWGQYNGICSVTTPTAPGTTKLVTSQCGVNISAVNTTLFATIVQGAQGYVFEVTNAGNTRTYESLDNKFNLDLLNGGGDYGTTYSIRVKIRYNSNLFTAYGASCNVTTPATPPTTRLVTSQCGVTLSAINTVLYANVVSGVQGYRFQATLSGVSRTFDATTNKFSLTDLTGITNYGATYSVKVAVKLNNVWGSYGSACNVTTPSTVPSTKLVTSQCGMTMNSLNQMIYANLVAGVQGYIFQVSEEGTTRTYESATNKFTLSNLSGGGEYGKTYAIRVAVRYNTTSLVSAYGASCNISTPNASPKEVLSEEVTQTALYPNPYSDSFKITFNSEEKTPVQVLIYDALGRLVSQKETTSANLENEELGQGLSTGIYTVLVQQGDRVKTLRVVKQ